MIICHCSLVGTKACEACLYSDKYTVPMYIPYPWPIDQYDDKTTAPIPPIPKNTVHRVVRIFEYDDKGRVTKETTEESEE